MSYVKNRNDFQSTNEDYFKGLSDTTAYRKKKQIEKQAKMDDDNPDAYEEMPGDKKARREGKVKVSKHTKSYKELYDDKKENESLSDYEKDEVDYDKLYKGYKYKKSKKKSKKNESTLMDFEAFEKNVIKLKGDDKKKELKAKGDLDIEVEGDDDTVEIKEFNSIHNLDLYQKTHGIDLKFESQLDEKIKQSTDRSPIDDKGIETGLKNKSKETGVPIGILRAVMRRGLAAWKSGHRPGAGQQQWGYARVNSFLTKQPGTWGKADADLAKEVRDGGHDKKLKKA